MPSISRPLASLQHGWDIKYNVRRLGPYEISLNLAEVGALGELYYPGAVLKNEGASGNLVITDLLLHIMEGALSARVSVHIWNTVGKILGVDQPGRETRVFATTLTVDMNAIPLSSAYNYETVHLQTPITLGPGDWLMLNCNEYSNCCVTGEYLEEI